MRALLLILFAASCADPQGAPAATASEPYVIALGTAQDGGLPQLGCEKECCESARLDPSKGRLRASLLLVDPSTGKRWLFEATPDLPEQLELSRGHGAARTGNGSGRPAPFDGIFLTHAHLGHYTGLAHLGREAYGASGQRVYCSQRMSDYLSNHGPWSQLVELGQIECQVVTPGSALKLREGLSVEAIKVPHREEFTDTYAWIIRGPTRSLLFLPDIDKWERFEVDITELVKEMDYSLLDATFYGPDELPGRDMAEIPHPFIVESIERFKELSEADRNGVHFLHLNHSNPATDPNSDAAAAVRAAGHHVCAEGQRFEL